MSSSSALLRSALLAAALAAAAALGACTLTPVHTAAGPAAPQAQLRYGEPASRLEQIVYQELALSFGRTDNPAAPRLRVSVSTSGVPGPISSSGAAQSTGAVTAEARAVVTGPDGVALASLARRATASYRTSGQVLADTAAATEAAERAARSAADSLRLSLAATLAAR